MAVPTPSSADFKARYPVFAPVADERVTLALQEATLFVDESWIESDWSWAIMALAAHMLALEGEPQASSGDGGMFPTPVVGPVASAKVGDVQATFKGWSAGGGGGSGFNDWLKSTSYGLAFLRYLRRSFPTYIKVF